MCAISKFPLKLVGELHHANWTWFIASGVGIFVTLGLIVNVVPVPPVTTLGQLKRLVLHPSTPAPFMNSPVTIETEEDVVRVLPPVMVAVIAPWTPSISHKVALDWLLAST